MSDEHAPYEKAIEETAKATGKAVDLIRDGGRAIGPAIGEIYGVLIGDKVSAARVRRLDKITRETQKILKNRNVTNEQKVELPEDIAIPLLEAAQSEPRDEMQTLWARLLANAMDPTRAGNIRPEFIETMRHLQPIDALMLQLSKDSEKGMIRANDVTLTSAYRKTAIRLSFVRLGERGCARIAGDQSAIINLTDYGEELMFALEP